MLLPRVTPLGGMFPVFWAQKGSYLVKTSWKMNPIKVFTPKIDVWDPKTLLFPVLGWSVLCYSLYMEFMM